MDFQQPSQQHIPEPPPALVERAIAIDTNDDAIVQKFLESAAQAFEDGVIAGKTEEEIIEITAKLVIQILIARQLRMDDTLMQHFYKQKEKIQGAFPKSVTVGPIVVQPILGTFGTMRKRLQGLLKGILI